MSAASVPSRDKRESSALFDLEALDAAPLTRDPFDFVIVPGFVRPEALHEFNRDFPQCETPGNLSLERLRFGPAFAKLVDALQSPELTSRFSAKFGVELADRATDITVRGFCEPSDGDIHTDHWSKVVTAVLYLNEEWKPPEGRLRLLRSASDIDDYVAEVPADRGAIVAFRRTGHSYHGHKRYTGPRRTLQLSWVKADPVAQLVRGLDRLGTRAMKRVSRLIQQ